MASIRAITPCLWFDDQAEEAATYYTGIFKNSRIGKISRYGEAGREITHKPPGSVMMVSFELEGQPFRRAQRRAGVQVQRGRLLHHPL
jgi:predicted 3-demethylubiquinone-9 3-methyltransferase (glyoxalase superfamily)